MKEEEGGSEADPEEGMELKEDCGEGEGEGSYLSEVERAASESEDGYGPPSQRYTADSLASSPASSSQLWVIAHKHPFSHTVLKRGRTFNSP